MSKVPQQLKAFRLTPDKPFEEAGRAGIRTKCGITGLFGASDRRVQQQCLTTEHFERVQEGFNKERNDFTFTDKSIYSNACAYYLSTWVFILTAGASSGIQVLLGLAWWRLEKARHDEFSETDEEALDVQVYFAIATGLYIVFLQLPRVWESVKSGQARLAFHWGQPRISGKVAMATVATLVDVGADLGVIVALVLNAWKFPGLDGILNLVAFDFIAEIDNQMFERALPYICLASSSHVRSSTTLSLRRTRSARASWSRKGQR